jgi:hypothetical protein
MNLTPGPATDVQMHRDLLTELAQVSQGPVTVTVPKLDRAIGAVQLESHLATLARRVDVRGRVIVLANHDAIKPTTSEDGRHSSIPETWPPI